MEDSHYDDLCASLHELADVCMSNPGLMNPTVIARRLRELAGADTRSHAWMQLGTHDADGLRTFAIPGDVCVECSDVENLRWVPVSQCALALKRWERDHADSLNAIPPNA